MTLYFLTGVPGSGKSLDAAQEIKRRLKRGIPVVCNFEINPSTPGYENFHYWDNFSISPDKLTALSLEYLKNHPDSKENTLLFVLDEAQLIFNTRSWNSKKDAGGGSRMAWIQWLSQHRHEKWCCYFLVQDTRMIDRQIRSLAEYEIKHRKLSNCGLAARILSLPFRGQLFVRITQYFGMKETLHTGFCIGRKSLYNLYNSYNKLELATG